MEFFVARGVFSGPMPCREVQTFSLPAACMKKSLQVSEALRIAAPMVLPLQLVFSQRGWICRIGIPGLSLEKTVSCPALR